MSVYAISDIHGAYNAYMALKAAVNYDNKEDKLYILGDIFDGNTNHPEDCLKILDDVISDDSITLLWGNHELAYFEYYNVCRNGNKNAMEVWSSYLNDPFCGGGPLLNYFYHHPDKQQYYMTYLQKHPAFQKIVEVDDSIYLLVHGAPIPLAPNVITNIEDIVKYQYASLNSTPNFTENLAVSVLTALACAPKNTTAGEEKIIDKILSGNAEIACIVGHTPTKFFREKLGGEVGEKKEGYKKKLQRVYHKNHIYCIDCGCRANSLNKTYDNSIVGGDLCMVKLGKKMQYTYYSKIKEKRL